MLKDKINSLAKSLETTIPDDTGELMESFFSRLLEKRYGLYAEYKISEDQFLHFLENFLGERARKPQEIFSEPDKDLRLLKFVFYVVEKHLLPFYPDSDVWSVLQIADEFFGRLKNDAESRERRLEYIREIFARERARRDRKKETRIAGVFQGGERGAI